MALTREQLAQATANRRPTKDVEVGGVGTVRLRSLSAAGALRFQSDVRRMQDEKGDPSMLAFPLVARCMVNDDGALMYPNEAEGIAFVENLDTDAFMVLAEAALALNGLDVGAVDRAEKNSEASRDGSSHTGSPQTSSTPTLT